MKPPKTAVLYARVSTTDQTQTGLGLDDQLHRLRGAAIARQLEAIEIVDDGHSAKSLDRPGMTAALELLAGGDVDLLIVTALDRLSRSVGDFARLLQLADRQGWALNVLDLGVDTSTASGELVANVIMAVAQWERRVIGERTSAAMQQLKAQGVRLGRPIDLPEPVRNRVALERANGRTLQAIADGLTTDGVPTARGGKWRPATISAVLSSIEVDSDAA